MNRRRIVLFAVVALALAADFSLLNLTPSWAYRSERASSFPPPPRALARVIHRTWHGRGEQTATCLSWAESKYNTLRRRDGASWSATGDHGYWQINYSAHHLNGESEWAFHARMRPTAANARAAYSISQGGRSWAAWTGTYGHGMCRGLN